MFGLLVGVVGAGSRGTLSTDRFLESTPSWISSALEKHRGGVDAAVMELPILSMPELESAEVQVAKVGRLVRLTRDGRNWSLEFEPNPKIAPIPSIDVVEMLDALNVNSVFRLHRTHFEVRDADLYAVLLERATQQGVVTPSRTYLPFPDGPQEPDLLTAMMPFKGTGDVWNTVRAAALSEDLRCERADSIWGEHSILGDIAGLLWRARLIVVDYTDSNPNVFYELGIAHTLGRPVIPIAKEGTPLPFDVQGLRVLKYDTTPAGLQKLELGLLERIKTILGPA